MVKTKTTRKKTAAVPGRKKKKASIFKSEAVFVKCTPDQKLDFQEMADKYSSGNISALVRFCVFNFDFKAKRPPSDYI